MKTLPIEFVNRKGLILRGISDDTGKRMAVSRS